MTPPDDTYIYLYCIAANPPVLPPPDDAAGELSCIRHADLYAVVGKVPANEFGQEQLERLLHDPEWLKRHVELHERVIEAVMKYSGVIPSKFAAVFFNEENLHNFLTQYAEKLMTKLHELQDRKEWGVKSCCSRSVLDRYLVENNPEITALDRELNSSSPGKAYLLKRKRQQLLEDVAAANINSYRKLFLEFLRSCTCAVQVNSLPPQDPDDPENIMILNSAVLVADTALPDFFAGLETLKNKFRDKGFSFVWSGPWPPYNFSQIAEA